MSFEQKIPIRIFIATTALLVLASLWYGRIEQPQSYHQFGDTRTLLGIPNAFDVLSNLTILAPGLLGLTLMYQRGNSDYRHHHQFEPVILSTLFAGMVITAFGSMWFHLEPSDATLVWDRLAMTIIMTGYCSLIVSDRFSPSVAQRMHFPLLIFGLITVLFWYFNGDLRPYFLFKFQAPILVVILLLWGEESYDRAGDYLVSMFFLLVASILEIGDIFVYETLGLIGGHALKHISAGIGFYWIMRMIGRRQAKVTIIQT